MKKILLSIFLLLIGILPVNATAKFLIACTTACTWDNTNDAIWSLSSGGANNTTHPVAADTVTLDANTCTAGVTCTITVNATISITSLTMGTCTASTTGCILDFSANDNNITMQTFSGTGTGTRTLNMGDGTWTLTATNGTVWDFTTATNLTFNANLSTIDFVATATNTRTWAGGSKTYNNVSVTNPASNTAKVRITGGSNTFANLSFNSNVRFLEFAGGNTQTVTNAFSYSGSTGTASAFVIDTLTPATLSVANATSISWLFLQGITKAGAGSITATNSFDGGINTGITIIQPSGGGAHIIGG